MLHDEALDYAWTDMASFLDLLERNGVALNLAQLVGHGTIRTGVKGGTPEQAADEEIAAMADQVRDALDGGAIGVSTGLGYAPGVFATTDELIGVNYVDVAVAPVLNTFNGRTNAELHLRDVRPAES